MPRFTLRTLFAVVTLIAVALGWLMWQRSMVQQRSQFLEIVVSNGGEYAMVTDTQITGAFLSHWIRQGRDISIWHSPPPEPTAESRGPGPFRRWLGDPTIFIIRVPNDLSPTVAEKAQSLFPEAEIKDSRR